MAEPREHACFRSTLESCVSEPVIVGDLPLHFYRELFGPLSVYDYLFSRLLYLFVQVKLLSEVTLSSSSVLFVPLLRQGISVLLGMSRDNWHEHNLIGKRKYFILLFISFQSVQKSQRKVKKRL